MSLTLSLSGQPFNGPDIGGFSENPSPELFAHWIAVGAFYPFSRGHACQGTIDKEPWAFGPEVEQVSRIALQRRYRLLPYLYTLFYEASQTNMPIMRPVFFADAKDAALRAEEQAFLLGTDLLVVPQWAKNVALPKGFDNYLSLVGEQPTDKYQPRLYQRNGSIVPVGKVIQSTAEFKADTLELFISPDASGKAIGKFYTDYGDGFEHEQGKFAVININASVGKNTVTVDISQTNGQLPTQMIAYKLLLNHMGKTFKLGTVGKGSHTLKYKVPKPKK